MRFVGGGVFVFYNSILVLPTECTHACVADVVCACSIGDIPLTL